MMYDNVSMSVFEEWIEPVIPKVGWIKGKKQVFPPRAARIILEHLEQPISKKALNV